jgi:hypothetical protein
MHLRCVAGIAVTDVVYGIYFTGLLGVEIMVLGTAAVGKMTVTYMPIAGMLHM